MFLGPAADLPGAAAPGVKLARIRVLGSKRFPERQITRASGLKLGSRVTASAFKQAADRLAASGAFKEVTYRYQQAGAGLSVVFRVGDAAKLYPCRFANFVWFSEEELREALRSAVPLFESEIPLTGNLPEQVDEALASLLKSRGIQGTVHHTMYAREGGPVEAVQFQVRGWQVRVARVEFEGAAQVDSDSLQAAVQPLLGQGYDQSFVRNFAVGNLTPVYWQRGYLQVTFGEPRAAVLGSGPAETSVGVTLPVEEGSQYRLAGLRWSGNTVFTSKELEKHIDLRTGEPANAPQLERDLEEIRERYGTRGHVRAALESRPVLDESAHVVRYDLEVREGDLYRMGRLEVLGVDSAHADNIKKRCKLRAGEPYDRSYWNGFLSGIGRYLPSNIKDWQIAFRQAVNDTDKTVDVTITLGPKGGP